MAISRAPTSLRLACPIPNDMDLHHDKGHVFHPDSKVAVSKQQFRIVYVCVVAAAAAAAAAAVVAAAAARLAIVQSISRAHDFFFL